MDSTALKTQTYTDFSGFEALKTSAREDNPEALRAVAKQFESVFLQMVMKSMRDANAVFKEGGMIESDSMDFYQDMFDQQISVSMTEGKGIGLADVLVRQLQKTL